MGTPGAPHHRDVLNRRVAGHDWWHTVDLAPGVLTPGWWDLRPTAARLPWPAPSPAGPPLAGLRCLDVGTTDGFWAFEMERRGAREVVAIDLVDPDRQDAPYRDRRARFPVGVPRPQRVRPEPG